MAAICVNSKNRLFEKKLLRFEVLDAGLKPAWLILPEVPIVVPSLFQGPDDCETLAVFKSEGETYPAIVRRNDGIVYNFDPVETLGFIMREQYPGGNFAERMQAEKLMRFNFIGRFIPTHQRKYVKKMIYLLFKNKRNGFPSWPIEESVELLRYVLLKSLNRECRVSWPENKKFAFAITHDVDSRKGISNIDRILEIEKRHGAVSTWFIAGCDLSKNKPAGLALLDNGCEVGLHGISHTYAQPGSFSECADLIEHFRIKGYRSPFLARSQALFESLEGLFRYDSSVPDTALLSPGPRTSGSCSIFPYRIGRLLEMPITLPLDSSLIFLGYKDDEILSIWQSKVEWIEKVGGIAILDIHAEPHFFDAERMPVLYDKFLSWVLSKKSAWIARLSEAADFWNEQNNSYEDILNP